MKKVIITGANGFIGKNLVRTLANKGIKVYAVVKDMTSDISEINVIPNVEIIYCSLRNILELELKINDRDIDVFYHFAWAGTSGNLRANYELQLENVKSSCDSVKAAKNMQIKKFVLAGSILEYECQKYISEDCSRYGLSHIYSTAKLSAHYMSKILSYNLGVDFINTIISNAYGVGEISQRLVNSTIVKLLKGEKTLFTKGDQLYDFIYIDDVVRAFELIGDFGIPFKTYYIGNKKPTLLKEFLITIRDCIDKNIQLGLGELPSNKTYIDYTEFSTMGLYEDFNFQPSINFEEGINLTTKWLRKKLQL